MTDFKDMTRAEAEAEIKEAEDDILFEKHGPRCATCFHGLIYDSINYMDSLKDDIAICGRDYELIEHPYEPNIELKECWIPM